MKGFFPFRFNPLDKRALKQHCLGCAMEGIPLWDRDISRYVYSKSRAVFNPLERFSLPAYRVGRKDLSARWQPPFPGKNPYWTDLFTVGSQYGFSLERKR
ncbi:hypothetical protein [Bacteroides acidifaciens]|uniref:hypothetical protein n=1 Tax=Bacteroides acidifaciens TaxID=85831 RepID=UPI003F6946DC